MQCLRRYVLLVLAVWFGWGILGLRYGDIENEERRRALSAGTEGNGNENPTPSHKRSGIAETKGRALESFSRYD
ncbi:MAG: hypothetical protein WD625_03050 [Balneolales bacterium]